MANLSTKQIEDAILATLGGGSSPLRLVVNGGYCRTLEPYAGQFEVDKIQDILVLFPAVFVVFVDEPSRAVANKQTDSQPKFTVLVADQNLRGNKEARRGAAGSIGTIRMLDNARDLLQGNRCGLTAMDPLQLVRRVAVVNKNDLSIYALELTARHLVDDL